MCVPLFTLPLPLFIHVLGLPVRVPPQCNVAKFSQARTTLSRCMYEHKWTDLTCETLADQVRKRNAASTGCQTCYNISHIHTFNLHAYTHPNPILPRLCTPPAHFC